MKRSIDIKHYTYELPPEKIATHPLQERDQSKLLVYGDGEILHQKFYELHTQLPSSTTLYFNNTRVIQARLHFEKESGAVIEVFLLHPVSPSTLLNTAMQSTVKCQWRCTIGNLKRWKNDTVLIKRGGQFDLQAILLDRAEGLVEFRWSGDLPFGVVVNEFGETPLPPYIKRAPELEDKDRYQTLYSKNEGAVAAPTAGLHFTHAVLEKMRESGIRQQFLTLHVSAGTFQPVKVENAAEHVMHSEQIVISRENVMALLEKRFVVAVGTTSMRSLESVYWYGAKLQNDPRASFRISQDDAYNLPQMLSLEESLRNVLQKMDRESTDSLTGNTAIYIVPGYSFRVCRGLITNFHQPGSTLMLLVAAFIGEDWRKIYQAALANNYRFLSYGDSSLLLPEKPN